MPDGTYAPQSPDLSSFLTTSSTSPASRTTPQQQSAGQAPPSARSQTSTYTPRSPNLSGFGSVGPTAGQSQSQTQPISPPPLGSHRALLGAVASGQVYIPPQSHQQQYTPGGSNAAAAAAFRYPTSGGGGDFAATSPQQQNLYAHAQNAYLPSIPDLPPSHAFPPLSSPAYSSGADPSRGSYAPQVALSYTQQQPPFKEEGDLSYPTYPPQYPGYADGPADPFDTMSGRVKRERNNNGSVLAGIPASSGAAANLGPSQGIEVRTKFPVARIKRIMQADEEVGKVAQVTPVAVSKALELFMISLVTKSATVARQSNSKRITATHLKKAIEADEQFDFLGEIVSRVQDHETKKGGAGAHSGGGATKKEEGDSDDFDSDDEEGAGGRKKKKGRR